MISVYYMTSHNGLTIEKFVQRFLYVAAVLCVSLCARILVYVWVCVCVYVCVCMCVCVWCTYVYVYLCICVVCICVCMCMCVCMCECIIMCMCVCMYVTIWNEEHVFLDWPLTAIAVNLYNTTCHRISTHWRLLQDSSVTEKILSIKNFVLPSTKVISS